MGKIIHLTNIEDDNNVIRINTDHIVYYQKYTESKAKTGTVVMLSIERCFIVKETVEHIDNMINPQYIPLKIDRGDSFEIK